MTTITESALNEITHNVNYMLESHGFALCNDTLTKLNDTLSLFLKDHCYGEIVEDKEEIDEPVVALTFDITSAEVTQYIKITNKAYSLDAIINGLNAGKMVTTTWHGNIPPRICLTLNGEEIASVMSQEIDGEYQNFA